MTFDDSFHQELADMTAEILRYSKRRFTFPIVQLINRPSSENAIATKKKFWCYKLYETAKTIKENS